MNKNYQLRKYLIAGIFSASAFCGSASAAIVSLDGDGFTANYDDTALGLFGTPTLSGDGKTILFSPLNFGVTATGSAGPNFGTQFAISNVQIDVIPDASQKLTGVSLIENGDYRLVDRNVSGTPSSPTADVFGELRLTNLQTGTQFVTNNFSATAPLTTTCSTPTCAATQWVANANLATPDSWADAAVRVRLENNLVAEAFQTGDSAFIEKKHASQTVGITPNLVPVPGAVWLFGSALVGLMGFRRKQLD